MKMLIYITIITVLGCGISASTETIRKFIPGTYARISSHEFGSEYDTLVISLEIDQYKILRKWKYERMLDGQKLDPEYRRSTTSAVFDNESRRLQEVETGDTYSFDLKKRLLINGTIKYRKL